MIRIEYEKPLKEGSQVTFYVDDNILTATVYNSYFIDGSYYLYFNNNHIINVNILECYFGDKLYNIFKPIVSFTIWPYTTLEGLERILNFISIFDEF